jgi:ParB family chromosome partitioning protein
LHALFHRAEEIHEARFLWLSIAEIIVNAQIRQQFEDDSSNLQELCASIRAHGVMQPILVRPAQFGRYTLVAGERRLRAAKMAGLLAIPAIVREMSELEADDMQLAENIQRKNLSQIEEAQKIQRDLNRLGSVEAVLAKHHKSKSWLSKMLGLLNLPEQARRLLIENISADTEVIAQLKIIEKLNPELARVTVDELKQTRGKQDARARVNAIKNALKPRSKSPPIPAAPRETQLAAEPAPELRSLLDRLYQRIHDPAEAGAPALSSLSPDEHLRVMQCLQSCYQKGRNGSPPQVLQRLQNADFSASGAGAILMLAFLHGMQNTPTPNWAHLLDALHHQPHGKNNRQ